MDPGPRSQSSGFLAGITAALLAAAGMLALGEMAGQPSIAETVAEAIAGLTPVSIIESMIGTFGTAAKRLLFLSVLVGLVLVGGALGSWLGRRNASPWDALAAATGAAALVGVVGLPLLGAGVLGAGARSGTGSTLISLAATVGLYFLAYLGMSRYLDPRGTFAAEDAASRRAFLRTALLTVGGIAAGIGTFRWLTERLAPPEVGPSPSIEAARTTAAVLGAPSLQEALAAGVPGLSTEITPNDKFYVVSKNVFRDPVVNAQTWKLEITGAVRRPLTLTYDQLKRLPSANQYLTLQCISNEVGGDLMGNADWRGVPLRALLEEAGVQPTAADVILRAADDYSDSIPIDKALAPGTMLAYEMNGEVLPRSHGFPARLLVPDIYGMKNVKWVTKIELLEHDHKGFWQVRGWSDVATMNTTSRIDVPKNASRLLPGPNYAGGIAVAGERGIRKVEVSTDGGRSWEPAVMKAPLSSYTWVLWLYEWTMPPASDAVHRILVRATDGTGAIQSATVRETLPDGATGLHAVVVRPAAAG